VIGRLRYTTAAFHVYREESCFKKQLENLNSFAIEKEKKCAIPVGPDALPHVAVIAAAVHRGHSWPPGQASPPGASRHRPAFSLGLFSAHSIGVRPHLFFLGLPDFSRACLVLSTSRLAQLASCIS
jgi:hypothetical protein